MIIWLLNVSTSVQLDHDALSTYVHAGSLPIIASVNHVALSSSKRVKTIQQGNFLSYVLALSPAQYNDYTGESSCNQLRRLIVTLFLTLSSTPCAVNVTQQF